MGCGEWGMGERKAHIIPTPHSPFLYCLLLDLARQDRVEQEREGRQALRAVLRAESEEDDAALTDLRLDHRRATADEFVAENPAAQQRVLRFRVTRDRAGVRRISDLEGRAV